MRLHEDLDSFRVLISQIQEKTGYRADVIEKDYYVTLVLKELAQKQTEGLPVYFKGGTALYKALKSIRRFSEDIDLSVDTRECKSRTQADKTLDKASKEFVSVKRSDPGGDRSVRSGRIVNYDYTPVVSFDEGDKLQRFGHIKVEATSFTISEPISELIITPLLYDYADVKQREILEASFDVCPFSIKAISLERNFIDKLFAAEAYYREAENPSKAFDAAKHIYDLCVLWENPRIQEFFKSRDEVSRIINIRLEEEKHRLDGIPGVQPEQFIFFNKPFRKKMLMTQYIEMQNVYVFNPTDKISPQTADTVLANIGRLFKVRICL